jgi:hypothetical protein
MHTPYVRLSQNIQNKNNIMNRYKSVNGKIGWQGASGLVEPAEKRTLLKRALVVKTRAIRRLAEGRGPGGENYKKSVFLSRPIMVEFRGRKSEVAYRML